MSKWTCEHVFCNARKFFGQAGKFAVKAEKFAAQAGKFSGKFDVFALKRGMLEFERVMNPFSHVKTGRGHNVSAFTHDLQRVIVSRSSVSFLAFRLNLMAFVEYFLASMTNVSNLARNFLA